MLAGCCRRLLLQAVVAGCCCRLLLQAVVAGCFCWLLLQAVVAGCCCWLLLLAVVRPTLEYGSEVWEANKTQAAVLESVMLGGAKCILGCSSKTCNGAVRGDMGLDTLQRRRDKNKLKWWYKLAALPGNRYLKKLFNQEWNFKPRRGRQRKCWSKVIDDLFS